MTYAALVKSIRKAAEIGAGRSLSVELTAQLSRLLDRCRAQAVAEVFDEDERAEERT